MKLASIQIVLGLLVLIFGVSLLTLAIREKVQDNSQTASYTLKLGTGDEQRNVTITFPTGTLSGEIIALPQRVYPMSIGTLLAIGSILPLFGLGIFICGLLQLRDISKKVEASLSPTEKGV